MRNGLVLPAIILTLNPIDASPGGRLIPEYFQAAKAESETREVSPVALWLSPTAGAYGRALGGGATLQMAVRQGWIAGLDFTMAEELCILCGYLPEKLLAGSLLLGYRHISKPVIVSIGAGPSWGRGEHRKPGSKPTRDSTCTWMCWDIPPETVRDEGVGFRIQTDFAIASRYIGIGGQFHLAYLPNHPYVGMALIVPMGRLY